MPISKVIYGDNTLIDLTQDTITAEKLGAGYTAHNASGSKITGTGLIYTESADITPIEFDYNRGYVNISKQTTEAANVLFYHDETPTKCYLDIYEITAGKYYSLSLGSVVGSRFRAGLGKTYTNFIDNVSGAAIKLHQVIFVQNAPVANQKVFFSNNLGEGAYPYLIVQKSNTNQTGLITHLREVTFN